jgi:tetratricopeptide (TPR) repeat protein
MRDDRDDRLTLASEAIAAGLSAAQAQDLPEAVRRLATGRDLAMAVLAEGDGNSGARAADLVAEAAGVLAQVHLALGRSTDALATLDQACTLLEQQARPSLGLASLHYCAGSLLRAAGVPERAAIRWRRSCELRLSLAPWAPETGMALNNTGRLLRELGDPAAADDLLSRALAVDRRLDPSGPGTAAVLDNLARAKSDLGQTDDGLALQREAVEILAQRARHSEQYATALDNLAMMLAELGQLDEALGISADALAVAQDAMPGSLTWLLVAVNRAELLLRAARQADAQPLLERALGVVRHAMPGGPLHLRVLEQLAQVEAEHGRLNRVCSLLEEGADALGAHGDTAAQTEWLTMLGRARADGRDLAGAQAALESAVALSTEGSPQKAVALGELGRLLVQRTRYGQAIEPLKRSIELRRRLGHHDAPLAARLGDLGLAFLRIGQVEQARRSLHDAEEVIAATAPDSIDAAVIQESLGQAEYLLGDLDGARRRFDQAIQLHRATGSDPGQTLKALGKLALVEKESGNVDMAAELLEEILAQERRADPGSRDVAVTLQKLGSLELERRNLDRAEPLLREAAELFGTAAPEALDYATTLGTLARLRAQRNDATEAEALLRQAAAVAGAVAGGSLELGLALASRGLILCRSARRDEGIASLEEGVRVLEAYRVGVGRGVSDAAFERLHPSYLALLDAYAERAAVGDDARAFAVTERTRARVLTELLAERDLTLRPETPEQTKLLEEERTARGHAAAAYNALAAARIDPGTDEETLVALQAAEADAEDALERARVQLRAGFPAYAALRYPELASLEETQALLAPGTLLLEYAVTATATHLFVVDRERVQFVTLPLPLARAAGLVSQAVGPYHAAEFTLPNANAAAAELGTVLLSPLLATERREVERLIVAPDGPLHYLPFGLLPDPGAAGGGRLVDRFSFSYVPSATTLRTLLEARRDRQPTQPSFVGFGDPEPWRADFPPLPGSRTELQRIAKRFAGRVTIRLGRDATEAAVRGTVAGHRYVHFATHGFADDQRPLYSGLVLSRAAADGDPTVDGLLQAYELFDLPLDGAVVVCSACETGLGRLRAGEGIVGLSRALFYAGAEALVLSLWRVPDLATAKLMDEFYAQLLAGNSVAQALRYAQYLVSRRSVVDDPLLWAAFVVVGLG